MQGWPELQSQPEPRYSLTAVDPVAGPGPLPVSVLLDHQARVERGRGEALGFYFKIVWQAGKHQVVLQEIYSIETTAALKNEFLILFWIISERHEECYESLEANKEEKIL